MKKFIKALLAICIIAICACSKEDDTYYVRFCAEAAPGCNVEEFHEVFLNLPKDTDHFRTSLTRYYCKSEFDEVFGKYQSGDKIRFHAGDSLEKEFMLRLYISRDKKEWELVEERYSAIEYYLP